MQIFQIMPKTPTPSHSDITHPNYEQPTTTVFTTFNGCLSTQKMIALRFF
jgi:hypothetical protein